MEAFFGVLCMLLFRRVIPDLADLDAGHLVALAWYGWLLFALVALTFIDLRHYIIPDEFSVYSIPVAVGGAALLGWLGYTGAPTWQGSAVGALVGFGTLGAVVGAYWLLRREEGMGMGDLKLLALIGGYFGAIGALGVIFLASIAGSIVGVTYALVKRAGLRLALPFGPFLAFGAVIWFFFSPHIEPRIALDLATIGDALRSR
jgi:leader peptidase (prepilin peptidase)/N-methyltransferase